MITTRLEIYNSSLQIDIGVKLAIVTYHVKIDA